MAERLPRSVYRHRLAAEPIRVGTKSVRDGAEFGNAGGDPSDLFGGGHVGWDVDDALPDGCAGGADDPVRGRLEVQDLGPVGVTGLVSRSIVVLQQRGEDGVSQPAECAVEPVGEEPVHVQAGLPVREPGRAGGDHRGGQRVAQIQYGDLLPRGGIA